MLLADDVSAFAEQGGTLPTVALFALVAAGLATLVRRRRVLTALAGVSVAVILGLTLTPYGGWSQLGFETGALRSIAVNLEPHRTAVWGWLVNSDGPANVVLFAPAGLFVALLSRRPVLTAAGLTALSFSIECWQATLTTRVGSFDDVVANGLGAALGACAAAVVLLTRRLTRPRPAPRREPARV